MGNSQLAAVEHIVVLMLENRSFDHMLGFLYEGNTTPSGEPFEGLTGGESNADASGNNVAVFKIDPAKPGAYFMPGCNPGEGYSPPICSFSAPTRHRARRPPPTAGSSPTSPRP